MDGVMETTASDGKLPDHVRQVEKHEGVLGHACRAGVENVHQRSVTVDLEITRAGTVEFRVRSVAMEDGTDELGRLLRGNRATRITGVISTSWDASGESDARSPWVQ